jgi:hypothetical protein
MGPYQIHHTRSIDGPITIHHPEAILITKNVDYDIEKPEDIFSAIKEEVKG